MASMEVMSYSLKAVFKRVKLQLQLHSHMTYVNSIGNPVERLQYTVTLKVTAGYWPGYSNRNLEIRNACHFSILGI